MDRYLAGGLLFGLGLLLILYSVIAGGLSTGYGMGVQMVVLRVGIAFVVLGVATITLRSVTIVNALVVFVITLSILFTSGAAVMYYDLLLTPPEYGTPLTVTRLIANQFEITSALSPIPAGYVAGVLARHDRSGQAVRVLVGTAIVAWITTSGIMRARGTAPGFTEVAVMVLTIAAMITALVPFFLMRNLTETQPSV